MAGKKQRRVRQAIDPMFALQIRVAERLRSKRMEINATQVELLEAVNDYLGECNLPPLSRSSSFMPRVESGRRAISIIEAFAFIAALNRLARPGTPRFTVASMFEGFITPSVSPERG